MSSSPVTSVVAKGRKGSAAGGGKAWTEEEEVYLLQMRLERVAYKKIASHLDKTELACRLHYHQLSHGGNRRKRNNSISSTSSNASATSPVASPSTSTTPLAKTRSSSPSSTTSFSPVNAAGAIQKIGSIAPPKIKGKPLLPKPTSPTTTSPRKTGTGTGTGSGGAGTGNKSRQALRVNCTMDAIDREKLVRIVEAQRAMFWESVATQYGGSMDADFLQHCWQKGFSSARNASTNTTTSNSSSTTTTTTTTTTATASPTSATTVTPLTPAISPPSAKDEDCPGIISTVSEASTPELSPTTTTSKDETMMLDEPLKSVDCIMTD